MIAKIIDIKNTIRLILQYFIVIVLLSLVIKKRNVMKTTRRKG